MKVFPGTPGTLTGLVLRTLQFVFAAVSIASMATVSNFFNYTAFCMLGAVIVIVGLYLLLWGKEGDRESHVEAQQIGTTE